MQQNRQIFISYAREDIESAKRLFIELKNIGEQPWIDKECLFGGQDWRTEINKAIRKSRYFIALLSQNSVDKRGYVQKELKTALDVLDEFPSSKIYLIPVRINDCRLSNENILKIQWIDMFPSWKKGFEKILLSITKSQDKIVNDKALVIVSATICLKPS